MYYYHWHDIIIIIIIIFITALFAAANHKVYMFSTYLVNSDLSNLGAAMGLLEFNNSFLLSGNLVCEDIPKIL